MLIAFEIKPSAGGGIEKSLKQYSKKNNYAQGINSTTENCLNLLGPEASHLVCQMQNFNTLMQLRIMFSHILAICSIFQSVENHIAP